MRLLIVFCNVIMGQLVLGGKTISKRFPDAKSLKGLTGLPKQQQHDYVQSYDGPIMMPTMPKRRYGHGRDELMFGKLLLSKLVKNLKIKKNATLSTIVARTMISSWPSVTILLAHSTNGLFRAFNTIKCTSTFDNNWILDLAAQVLFNKLKVNCPPHYNTNLLIQNNKARFERQLVCVN